VLARASSRRRQLVSAAAWWSDLLGVAWSALQRDLPVYVLAMTDLENGHLQAYIVYEINDSEVALTDSIAIIVSRKLFRAVRTRIFA